MDAELVQRFVRGWEADWNSHDLERILTRYTEDVEFWSPHIVARLGDPSGVVRGKPALRNYWGSVRESDLHFAVEDVRYSVDTLVINYRNQHDEAVAEVLRVRDGLVFWGCGAYAPETHPLG